MQQMASLLLQNFRIIFCIISLQTVICNKTYGQVGREDTTILLKVFREVSIQELLVYVDKVNMQKSIPIRLKEFIQSGKLSNIRKNKSGTLSALTKAEKKYLLTNIKRKTNWPDNLFANSKRINADSLWTFLNQENINRITNINKAALNQDSLAYKKATRQFPFVFVFTKPVYIRNNTICLISFAAMCGRDCGRDEISFYKKENNVWTKWIVVSAGDF